MISSWYMGCWATWPFPLESALPVYFHLASGSEPLSLKLRINEIVINMLQVNPELQVNIQSSKIDYEQYEHMKHFILQAVLTVFIVLL